MINIPLTSTFKNTGFKQAEKSIGVLEKSTGRLAGALAATFSARQLGRFTKTSIMAASRLEESMSKVSVVFGNASAQVESFGRSSAANLGISSSAALEAAGTYGNLLQAFGIGQTQAKDMSLALVQLAADMASFNNTSIDQAITALRSGLSGETEPLKRFGVALTDARLRTEALSMGLVESTKEALGPAIKAQAAYSLIMKDTTLAQGDFKRTSDGVANSLRILSASAENATAIIGEGLIKSIDLLVDRKDGVQTLANTFEDLAQSVSNAVVGLADLISNARRLGGILPEGKGLTLEGLYPNIPGILGFQFLAGRGGKINQADLMSQIGFGTRQSPRVAEMQFAQDLKRWKQQQKAIEKLRKEQERIAKAEKAARLEAERRKKILQDLAKASDILDTEKASIEAALKNETLSENEILRLKLKKAILNENADKALELAKELEKSQNELGKLKALSDTFKPVNPFQAWLDTIDELDRKIALIGNVTAPSLAKADTAQSLIEIGAATGNQGILDAGVAVLSDWIKQGMDASMLAGLEADRAAAEAAISAQNVATQVVNVNMAISNLEGDLPENTKKQIVDTVVEASGRGFNTGWFRTTGTYAIS